MGRHYPKRVRRGPHFYKGDDLRKVKADRKRRGYKYESWERRKRKSGRVFDIL